MEPTKKYRVFLITLCSSILYTSFGTVFGWTSPIMPKLRNQTGDTPLESPITISEEGWISALITFGGFFTSLFAGAIAGRIGRKRTLLLSSVFFAVPFVLFIYAKHVSIICVGRFLQGIGGGLTSGTLPVYIGEIAPDDFRGVLLTFYHLFMIFGIIYTFSIGPFVSYVTMQYFCLALPVIFFCTFCFMPESPFFLATKGRKKDGVKALKFIRGQSMEAAKLEMNRIQKFVDESMSNKGTLVDIMNNAGYRKALIISCGLMIFQALSGTTAITFNCQTIFISAESTLDPALASVLIGCVQLIFNCLTPLFIESLGRKIILMISAAGMALALFILGTFFYVKSFAVASSILWIPVPTLIFFYAAFAFGFGTIPWAILGEIFPTNIKSTASSIATMNIWGMTFIVTRWYPELDALGSYYAFWFFGSMCIVSIIFIKFVMIETKGLSLQEIQLKLQGKKSMSNGKMYEEVEIKVIEKK